MEYQGVVERGTLLVGPGGSNRHRLAILRDHTGTGGRDFTVSFGRGLGSVLVDTLLRDGSDLRIARHRIVLAVVGSGVLSVERLSVDENNRAREMYGVTVDLVNACVTLPCRTGIVLGSCNIEVPGASNRSPAKRTISSVKIIAR